MFYEKNCEKPREGKILLRFVCFFLWLSLTYWSEPPNFLSFFGGYELDGCMFYFARDKAPSVLFLRVEACGLMLFAFSKLIGRSGALMTKFVTGPHIQGLGKKKKV